MTTELPPKYNPTQTEQGRYEKWLAQGVFKLLGDKKAQKKKMQLIQYSIFHIFI
ncbi:MAG: hypothetical protein LBI43_04885 [Streptococcaceae bacterium]|jgi:valyl-tRNA synthetase|nr:hypothetical protein [Streptococcaceae bacterium]